MKKFLSILLCAAVVSCTSTVQNPLMKESTAKYGTPEYSKIKNEYFYPSFVKAIERNRAEIDAIANNPEAATFQNTIEALEFSGADLSRISGIFFNLTASNTNDTLQDVSFKISPMLTELSNYSMMNDKLFARVKSVWEGMNSASLTPIQKRLTDNYYQSFKRSGAELSVQDKATYSELSTKLAHLSLQFDKNNLDATNAYTLVIDKEDVAELPQFVKDMSLSDAKAKGLEGWIITLQAPSYAAFMKYSTNRKKKEELWRASSTLCLDGQYSNQQIIKDIVNIRLEMANLLGYKSHAEYVLERNMAKTPEAVDDFLAKLSTKSMTYAKNDIATISKYARSNGARYDIMPWDFAYWSNRLMSDKFSISDEVLKPYFKLEIVRDGIFELCNRLYGIKFIQNTTADPYQQDVMVYDVIDQDGKLLSVLYMDFFPRDNKGGGAWMSTIRDQKIVDGKESRPLVTVVCNFSKPTNNTPSLLTHSEVVTFLHEFGHAIHGMFATGDYPSLSGTNVAIDFVELPSQIMENWAVQKEFLALFARHYQTGEVISDELVDRIIASRNFNAGYTNARQLSYGLLDMAWHTIQTPQEFDIELFEAAATKSVAVLPQQKGTAVSPIFGHIFAGDYSAGYYSYKWAEVLEADAFGVFEESGIFDRAMGEKFRETILSRGGAVDAMELYVDFVGRQPEPQAIFKKYQMK